MAHGGYEPLPDYDDDYPAFVDDDDDNAVQTGAFVPFSSSTPYSQEFQTTQREKSGLQKTTSWLEDLTDLPGLSTTTLTAEGEIDKEFPNVDKNKIKFMMDRKGRTKVGLISPKKPYYNLLTQIPGKSGEYQINPQLPKEVLRALGESRRQTIEKEIGRLSEGIIENKKIAEDTTKDQTERNKARERAQRQISSRVDLQKQLDQLKAGEYTRDGSGQSIPLEIFQNNEEKRREREKQLQQGKQEQEKMINDENTPISEIKKLKKKSKKLMKN